MKVVTFGELMVRLQPFNYERFVQANSTSSASAAARLTLLFLWPTTVWTQLLLPSCPHTPSVRPLSTACAATALIPA